MSSPGRIYVFAQEASHVSALLYNFDINSPVVKPQHRDWLNNNTSRYFSRNMKALVIGLASRSGSDSFNMNLSRHRATNVENIINNLAPVGFRPIPDLRVAFGEKAAAIAGFADGVEDQRWRAVFLSLLDPSKVPVNEVLDNRVALPAIHFIKRRSHVEVLVGQEMSKNVPMDEHDRAAEGWFQLGTTIAADQGWSGDQIQRQEFVNVREDWTILKITIKRCDVGTLYTLKMLDVWYEWGSIYNITDDETGSISYTLKQRTLVIKPSDEELKIDPKLKDKIRPLSVEQMNMWLNKPYQAWRDLND